MTTYVRLMNGMEDAYDAYRGCPSCGYAPWGFPCPACDSEVTRDAYYNPSAQTPDDGSLTIKRWNTRLGHYPAGAWMSWRSD